MNGAHLHLIVNHLPVVSALFALAFLFIGLVRRSEGLIKVGLIVSVVVGLTGTAAFVTGEPAEDVLEQWPGADKALIHEHEETAENAFRAAVLLGLIGLVGLIFSANKPAVRKSVPVIALLVALLTTALMALASNQGGEIRHPEIRDGATPPTELSTPPAGEVDDSH